MKHLSHALVDGLIFAYGDKVGITVSADLNHRCCLRGFAEESHFRQVVSLTDDTNNFVGVRCWSYSEGADSIGCHSTKLIWRHFLAVSRGSPMGLRRVDFSLIAMFACRTGICSPVTLPLDGLVDGDILGDLEVNVQEATLNRFAKVMHVRILVN